MFIWQLLCACAILLKTIYYMNNLLLAFGVTDRKGLQKCKFGEVWRSHYTKPEQLLHPLVGRQPPLTSGLVVRSCQPFTGTSGCSGPTTPKSEKIRCKVSLSTNHSTLLQTRALHVHNDSQPSVPKCQESPRLAVTAAVVIVVVVVVVVVVANNGNEGRRKGAWIS